MAINRRVSDFNRQELVILFCDLHEFSKIMRMLSSRSIDLIQSYYDTMGTEIVTGGGRIIKYLGDSILAVFPKDSEPAAVETALRMRPAYARLLQEYSVSLPSEIEIGIGAGTVAAGVFGHESLLTYDVFGETVNEVTMIMHHLGIAVTGRVREKVSSRFPTRRLRGVRVKWKDEPLEVWEIIEERVD